MDALPADLHPALRRRAEAAAAWLREQKASGRTVTVVHHIDADGVSAAAIAATCLDRAGIPFITFAAKSMDDSHVAQILAAGGQALWFCDLGSTVYMRFPDTPRLVCDHHQLVRDGSEESFAHLNPLLDGLSGEEISGAGCAYLAAAALDAVNLDLLPMALVGASGDLQDRKQRRFTGANAALVALGRDTGLLDAKDDLAFFGSETRPLRRFLSGASEPAIPGLSGAPRNVERLCRDAGVALEQDGVERSWSMLDDAERRALRSALVDHLLDLGLADDVPRLTRQVVTFRREQVGTPVREPQEFGTLLNSTARYGRAEVGLAVARGDRGAAYGEALGLLLDHRKHLAGALDAFARSGVTERTAVQWVHLEDKVLDTVVGIVCGMALDGLGLRRDLALLGFAWTPDGKTKVSSRSPHELQARGIDLSLAMRECSALFGGQGGGHKGAAGATIPRGCEAAFVDAVDRLVGAQIGVRVDSALPALPHPPVTRAPLVLPSAGKQTRLAL
ncbi:MAG: DHH family phosphoesterase [Candidatus Thermoplasmatota archaeon]